MGYKPFAHDHPVHLHKAWLFFEDIIWRGKLSGWSSFWAFGYPAGELYPPGTDLWVSLFRILSLGHSSWEISYAWAFAGFFAFGGYALFRWGARWFSPVAGFAAACFWLLDSGGISEGGWIYTVQFGVWAQALGLAFFVLGLAHLKPLLETSKGIAWKPILCSSVWFGLGLLTHQTNVLLMALGLGCICLARIADMGGIWRHGGNYWRTAARDIWRIALVGGLGLALAAFWLCPMLLHKSWTNNIGKPGISLSLVWHRLWTTGSVFDRGWAVVSCLAILGLILGWRKYRSWVLFLALFAATFFFFGTTAAYEWLSLASISPDFTKLIYHRLLIPAKIAVFLLAGLGLQQIWTCRTNPLDFATGRVQWRAIAQYGLALGLTGWAIFTAVGQFYTLRTKGLAALRLAYPDDYWQQNYRQFTNWATNQKKLESDFYRIAIIANRNDHRLMGSSVIHRTPLYKMGYTPVKLFRHFPEERLDLNVEEMAVLLRKLSIKYAVSTVPLKHPLMQRKARWGNLYLFRFVDYSPKRWTMVHCKQISHVNQANSSFGPYIATQPISVAGSHPIHDSSVHTTQINQICQLIPDDNSVQQITFDEEYIHLRLNSIGQDAYLQLHVANYGRWRAQMNGRSVTIREARARPRGQPMLIEIPVTDGDLIVSYHKHTGDFLGFGVTIIAVLVLIIFVWLEMKQSQKHQEE
jgi:hypothetical protein